MTVLGYVVIEYNQASRCPDLMDGLLFDTADDAAIEAKRAQEETQRNGRGESYSIAQVVGLEP